MIGFFTQYFLNFENSWVIFILFDWTKNGLVLLGLVILSPRLLPKLGLSTILLKCALNVSASWLLFVIVSLLFFNVIHSLLKAFPEKRGLIVFQNFLLSLKSSFSEFRKQSSLFLRQILTQRFVRLLWNFRFVRSSRKYLFRSFHLFLMAFLKFLAAKLKLFLVYTFAFLDHACQVLTERIQKILKYFFIICI